MVVQKYSPNMCRQKEALSDDNFRETTALVGFGLIFFSELKIAWTSKKKHPINMEVLSYSTVILLIKPKVNIGLLKIGGN